MHHIAPTLRTHMAVYYIVLFVELCVMCIMYIALCTALRRPVYFTVCIVLGLVLYVELCIRCSTECTVYVICVYPVCILLTQLTRLY